MRTNWQGYIVIDPDLHDGEPCIHGMTFDEIMDAYPQLKRESIQAALAYAAEIVRQDVWLPLAG